MDRPREVLRKPVREDHRSDNAGLLEAALPYAAPGNSDKHAERDPTIRHRDASGRVRVVDKQWLDHEQFLRPSDGRLVPLKVQGFDKPIHRPREVKWIHLGRPRVRIPSMIRLVYWAYSSVLEEGSEERKNDFPSLLSLWLMWIPACFALLLLLFRPQNLEGETRNGGCYDPIRYRDWGYPKEARNPAENRHEDDGQMQPPEEDMPLMHGYQDDIEMSANTRHVQRVQYTESDSDDPDADFDDLPGRHTRPRYLCFLRDAAEVQSYALPYETIEVSSWIKEHGDNTNTDYVFVSYTRKQFCVASAQEMASWQLPNERVRAELLEMAEKDRMTLLHYGARAARAAGVPAFWIDFEGIRPDEASGRTNANNDDVWRICDVVRGAHSMITVLGPPISSRTEGGERQTYSAETQKRWLREWGSRLWVLPEILLCSPEHRISIHAVGAPHAPEKLAKRTFAARACQDWRLVRQLTDHYESSIHLTPLELVSIALECFQTRQTDQWNKGDMAYALMGLLRRRPKVNKNDTSFEAFARLSLANNSDLLLERLICMLPERKDAPWFKIKDAWGAQLWDIEPICQVAGIVGRDQTVTLDGAYGATIQWESLDPVAFFKRPTMARTVAKVLLRGVPAYFVTGLAMVISAATIAHQDASISEYYYESGSLGSGTIALIVIGVLVFLPALVILFASPAMLLSIYRGKFWSTQALFIGVEGNIDLGIIERYLFGFNHGRLKWSTSGSLLSQHHRSRFDECLPNTPITQKPAAYEGSRFTLIDTYTMTATSFYAERPPTAVIVCGREGGMQRAVLCSYEWRTQTFCRETVIRLKTLALDRMFRVDRFRFALSRQSPPEPGKV